LVQVTLSESLAEQFATITTDLGKEWTCPGFQSRPKCSFKPPLRLKATGFLSNRVLSNVVSRVIEPVYVFEQHLSLPPRFP
jgi:hypothetical protein